MQNDVVRRPAGTGLVTHTHPAVRPFLRAARRNGIGKCEKARGLTPSRQTLLEQVEFMVEHVDQTVFTDVSSALTVDLIRKAHVISRHRLGDGMRGLAGLEKMPRDFLSGANFGESAVDGIFQIDL